MDFKSVEIYLGIFILSLAFSALAEVAFKNADKNQRSGSRAFGFFLAAIAIVIPCILAAIRDVTVGNDIAVYLSPNYIIASNCRSFLQFYGMQYPVNEPLFALLIFIGAKLGNIGYTFFLIEFLTILPIYIVLYFRRKDLSMTMGMAIFFFFFYNFSLSGMRQSIAMSFLLLAYHCILNKKRVKAIVLSVIAALFHTSVFLMVLLYFGSYYIYTRPKKIRKRLYVIVIVVLVALFFLYGKVFTIVASVIEFVSPRYAYYIMKYAGIYQGHIWSNVPSTDLICKIMLILIVVLFYKSAKKYGESEKYAVLMMLIGRYFVLFNANFYESLRFAYYFDYLLIIFVPCVKKCMKKDFINQLAINLIVILPAFIYWFYFIMGIGGYVTNSFKVR